jgi:hypothetical protein
MRLRASRVCGAQTSSATGSSPQGRCARGLEARRLSRSLQDVLRITEKLGKAKAGFRSLSEAIDTTTPAGRMMMQMVGRLRNSSGPCSKSAPRPGSLLPAGWAHGGRRPKLPPQQQAEIKKMVSRAGKTAADAARLFKIHPATVSRLVGAGLRQTACKLSTPSNLQSDSRYWKRTCRTWFHTNANHRADARMLRDAHLLRSWTGFWFIVSTKESHWQ